MDNKVFQAQERRIRQLESTNNELRRCMDAVSMSMEDALNAATHINIEWGDEDYRITNVFELDMENDAPMPCLYAVADDGTEYEFNWKELMEYQDAGELVLYTKKSIAISA